MEAKIQITQTTYPRWYSYLKLKLKFKSPDFWSKVISLAPEKEREERG